jgi:hypothetical protein
MLSKPLISMRDHFRAKNMEYQFWFYELGNVVATISGTGGFKNFAQNLTVTFSDSSQSFAQQCLTLSKQYPDATVAIGIGAVAVAGPLLHRAADRINTKFTPAVDAGSAALAAGILAYALSHDTSFITVSASAFVVGSSLLRFALANPFFLKAGGLALAGGGAALTAFGIENSLPLFSDPHILNTVLDATTTWQGVQAGAGLALAPLTAITGAYVTSASFLTYEGGIYQTMGFQDDQKPLNGWVSRLCHPVRGSLAKAFHNVLDKPIQALNRLAKSTMLTYIPQKMRDNMPFATSMWARLPFRVLTGTAAAITGNFSFALANLSWGCGDTAIGQEDYKKKETAAPSLEQK